MFDMECNCDCPLPKTHELFSAPHKHSMPWGGLHRSGIARTDDGCHTPLCIGTIQEKLYHGSP